MEHHEWYHSMKMSVRSHKHGVSYMNTHTIPVDRFLRLCARPAVKMVFTLWAQICWLPSSVTPQRGSAICLKVALSSSPVTGRRDNHWNSLQRGETFAWCSSWTSIWLFNHGNYRWINRHTNITTSSLPSLRLLIMESSCVCGVMKLWALLSFKTQMKKVHAGSSCP